MVFSLHTTGKKSCILSTAFPLLSLLIDAKSRQLVTGCANGQVREAPTVIPGPDMIMTMRASAERSPLAFFVI